MQDDISTNISYDSNIPINVICGICRIWVKKEYRRKGIAKCLIESARLSSIYGVTLIKDDIAFSQTTALGNKLATNYFGRPDYLIFIE
jgi:GNAT superfamily N-acetyltransferase